MGTCTTCTYNQIRLPTYQLTSPTHLPTNLPYLPASLYILSPLINPLIPT
jgi:hypothetical protein